MGKYCPLLIEPRWITTPVKLYRSFDFLIDGGKTYGEKSNSVSKETKSSIFFIDPVYVP